MNGKVLFSTAHFFAHFSTTCILIAAGLSGQTELAANVAISQGAALALFYGFSANARSLILRSTAEARALLLVRVALMLPLVGGVVYLGTYVGEAPLAISFLLALRKCADWICEIPLSIAETEQQTGPVRVYLASQAVTLLLTLFYLLHDQSWLTPVLSVWALTPLLISNGIARWLPPRSTSAPFDARQMLPHFGSSAVMGFGVYVFRVIVVLLVGKSVAGDLFTGFAIGGFLGSAFSFGIGPAVVREELRSGSPSVSPRLSVLLWVSALAGMAVLAVSYVMPAFAQIGGKSMAFVSTVGASLIGGVVMVFAQRQRLRDLQSEASADVYATDVLANLLIVVAVSPLYLIFGNPILPYLYVLNAAIGFVLYWMADPHRVTATLSPSSSKLLGTAISALLVLPVFVTLQSGIFRSTEFIYDSQGDTSRLPIPLSLGALYLALAVLGNYRRAGLGLTYIFATFVIMTFASVIAGGSESVERSKILLMTQYVVVMFALPLGMLFDRPMHGTRLVAKVSMVVVATIVPIQLAATWWQGRLILTPYMYAFSVYQHLQYVPVIFLCLYILALFSLSDLRGWSAYTFAMAPVMAVYIVSSSSLSALLLGLLGFVSFAALAAVQKRGKDVFLRRSMLALGVVLVAVGFHNLSRTMAIPAAGIWSYSSIRPESPYPLEMDASHGIYSSKLDQSSGSVGLGVRFQVWQSYIDLLLEKPSTFLFGQTFPPSRVQYGSAHNYYLDCMTNFGVLSVLPVLVLVLYTVHLIWRRRAKIFNESTLFGLSFVVVWLLVIENSLKTGLRAPYPGILSFFLWGLLLSLLSDHVERANSPHGKVD